MSKLGNAVDCTFLSVLLALCQYPLKELVAIILGYIKSQVLLSRGI